MGDEWLLKIAFQYRWGNEEDRNVTNRRQFPRLDDHSSSTWRGASALLAKPIRASAPAAFLSCCA
jgi:hypothetical protein